VVLSWLRFYISNELKVDGVVMDSTLGLAITVLFFGCIGLQFFSFYKLEFEELSIHKYAQIINLISLFMLPCLSNDIFSLLGYGDAFDYTSSVFSTPVLSHSIFYNYVSNLYTTTPNVYGLGSLSIAKVSIVNSSVLASIFSLKFFSFVLVSISLYLLNKIGRIDKKNLGFVVLNPLWTIQALGQTHTEVIAVSLLFLSLYYIHKNGYLISACCFGLAVLTKVSFVVCFPILIYYFYQSHSSNLRSISLFFLNYMLIGSGFLGCIYFYFGNIDVLSQPLHTLNTLWPTGSFCAYIHDLWQIKSLIFIFKVLFFIYLLGLYLKYKSVIKSKISVIIYFCLIAFLLLFTHRFLTWYLLLVLPIFFWIESKNIKRDFLILCCALTLQDAAHFNQFKILHLSILVLSIIVTIIYQLKILSFPFLKKN
jgi:hypothetical protein